MSVETFIARQMAREYVEDVDPVGARSITALCVFADLLQDHFQKESLMEILQELEILD